MGMEFWKGRRVLLTGHTGFKGSWLALWLTESGAVVEGVSLPPASSPNLFELAGSVGGTEFSDIRDDTELRNRVMRFAPEVVIHMAAQALVKRSYVDPLETFAVNVDGTAAVLDACRDIAELRAILVITSDKVYENLETGRAFVESDTLGGGDPYSASKACAELVTKSFRKSFFASGPRIGVARAGNVIGGGDWSADRLIPDCLRALEAGVAIKLRYPDAVRPWQHVLEPVSGYLLYLEALMSAEQTPAELNFGPSSGSMATVRHVVERFSAEFRGALKWDTDSQLHVPEAGTLLLDSTLAIERIGWTPLLSLDEALAWTAEWYDSHRKGKDMRDFTITQIRNYTARLATNKVRE